MSYGRLLILLFFAPVFPCAGVESAAATTLNPSPEPSEETPPSPPSATPTPSGSVPARLPDKGIWPELDPRVTLAPPSPVEEGVSIIVDKSDRLLVVLVRGTPVAAYPVSLGFSPTGHKLRQGDGRTPEGSYFICERLSEALAPRYGARSLRLSYPNADDAAAGLSGGLITPKVKGRIEQAVAKGQMPPQNTPLGSSIRIHGGGIEGDWTAGCIALRDPDVVALYELARVGTPVHVFADGAHGRFGDLDGDGIPNQVDGLLGAKKTVLNGAEYDGRYVEIPFPEGDVPRTMGVCTDVVVRALRNAGLDLQRELQRDLRKAPKAYPRIKSPNPSIDHRRVKNLFPWFRRHWRSLPADDLSSFLPGDVIFMDTLSARGPDHVGIVSDRRGESGHPLIINNWTYGAVTDELDLLPFVPVTAHFRWRR